ncbi:MAG: porin family protein [Phycisphaerales bacterium]|nr:porin family protein [Phycisphaerales bacterium]
MFIRFLYLTLLFLIPTRLWAQQKSYFNTPDKNGRDRTFFGGFVIGMNPTQVDGDNFSGYHKFGLNTGLISFVKMSPTVVASLELLFSQKGAKNVEMYHAPAVGSVPIIYTAKLNYVEIPVMLHYQAQERIQLGLGVSYARLISDKEEMDSYTSSGSSNLQNTFRQSDFNYLIGIKYQLYHNFFAAARYQYSIFSIRDADKIPIQFGTTAQFNNLFALQIITLF